MFQRHPVQNQATMFITTNTQGRRPVFDDPSFAHEAIAMLYRVQTLHPFLLYAFAIMPDHCHFLLRVLDQESISTIMRVYKYGLTFNLGIGAFWQSRFHVVIPDNPFGILRYIHGNPVKAGLCEKPDQYPWSSACGKWNVSESEWGWGMK